MKKFLTVLLVIAVMFTFSFGSAFAATVDKTPITNAQAAAYTAIEKAGSSVLEKFKFDTDGAVTAYYDANGAAVTNVAELTYITKSVVESVIADKVEAAKAEVQKVATAQSAAVTEDSQVAAAVTAVQAAGETQVVALPGAITDNDALTTILAEQLKANKKAAKTELENYTTTQYSDDTDEWAIKGDGTYGIYNVANVTTGLEAGKDYSAKAFVEAVIKAQLDAATSDTATLTSVAAATKIAKDIITGHKIAAAPDNYYMDPVPTADDLKADTTVATAKSYAINKMEAALAAKIADMKEIANDVISAESKKAKPDTDKVAAYQAFLADVDAQAAAAKEVYTAQINAQKTTAAVYTKDATNAISGGILKTILDEIAGLAGTYANDEYTCATLDAKVVITKNVDQLEDYANVLLNLVDREGQPMYDANAIKDALASATEKLYLGTATLAEAKSEVNAAANVSDTLILQKDKFIDAIEGTEGTYDSGVASIKLGTKTYDAWPGATAYEGAQKDAYKAVAEKTINAIKDAKSYDEIVSAFVAGCNEYAPIITKAQHAKDWANGGVLAKEYANKYKTELEAYVSYTSNKMSSDYSISKAAINTAAVNAAKIVKEAYTVEELPGKVAEAKAYLDSLKSNDEINAQKKAVEALITALPTNVTLADKENILAAKKANEEYEEIPGFTAANNKLVLTNDVKALAALELKAINDQVAAIQKAGVTVDSEAAINALADAIDAYETNYEAEIDAAAVAAPSAANNALYGTKTTDGFYDLLSDAQVDAVAKQCAAVSLNPTTSAEIAAVKDAKAAFDALSIHQQASLISKYNVYYDKLSQAQKILGEAVQALKITASSTAKKGSITVKWTVKGNAAAADGYQIFRSVKENSGYGTKPIFTTTKLTYKNTKALKKGTRYYYKVRAYKVVDGVKVYSDWSNKARRIAK